MDLKTLTSSLGITRILELISNCICFSLMASEGLDDFSIWIWCLFTWSFSFCTTLLILILELFGLNQQLPFSWNDFTAAYSIGATLMVFSSSVIMSVGFATSGYAKFIATTFFSYFSFGLYVGEVHSIRNKSEEISAFLSTIPGILKIIEAFVASIIFICLSLSLYPYYTGLKWCVSVYSIGFIVDMLFIITIICRLESRLHVPLDKVMLVFNVMGTVMYMIAVILWPVFGFKHITSDDCSNSAFCLWKIAIVITSMTCVNFVINVVNLVYSVRKHFCSQM
ncbi:Myeloid-associated differentiation marker-like [Oryzias melastigma]|uniref:Myeloid-associated differentiation marker-like n=1 Tax=Oryzias melastigma TaxID=30732 RepID=A0A834FHY7_ORYME|nr:Myeloid-associated differentiation marker-like [Oryzias melastigma]